MKSDIVRLVQEFCPSRALIIRKRGKLNREAIAVGRLVSYGVPLLVGATRLQPIHSITHTLAKCPQLCMARCPAPGLITIPDCPADQTSLIDGRCNFTSRRCFSSRGSICSFQNDDAMAGSSSHFRVLMILSSTFTRRRPPRRRYSSASRRDGVSASSRTPVSSLLYSSPGTRPAPHARDRRAAASRKHRPTNLSRGRQRMRSPGGGRKACWSQRPFQRTTCLHSNLKQILVDRSCRSPLFQLSVHRTRNAKAYRTRVAATVIPNL